MPLDPKDARWSDLPGSYGDSRDVVAWISEAVKARSLSGVRLGDLINEVGHQGDVSLALYAVVPHLVSLASLVEPSEGIDLLIHAGLLCASTGQVNASPCPDFLLAEYREAASKGAESLAPRLLKVKEFESFKYAVAALAGFMGYTDFESQRVALWHAVGGAMRRRVGSKPVWLSTAGAGVSSLHVRLDDRPKYYGFAPFRHAK
jgi:uncharacterized protein DUF6940